MKKEQKTLQEFEVLDYSIGESINSIKVVILHEEEQFRIAINRTKFEKYLALSDGEIDKFWEQRENDLRLDIMEKYLMSPAYLLIEIPLKEEYIDYFRKGKLICHIPAHERAIAETLFGRLFQTANCYFNYYYVPIDYNFPRGLDQIPDIDGALIVTAKDLLYCLDNVIVNPGDYVLISKNSCNPLKYFGKVNGCDAVYTSEDCIHILDEHARLSKVFVLTAEDVSKGKGVGLDPKKIFFK